MENIKLLQLKPGVLYDPYSIIVTFPSSSRNYETCKICKKPFRFVNLDMHIENGCADKLLELSRNQETAEKLKSEDEKARNFTVKIPPVPIAAVMQPIDRTQRGQIPRVKKEKRQASKRRGKVSGRGQSRGRGRGRQHSAAKPVKRCVTPEDSFSSDSQEEN